MTAITTRAGKGAPLTNEEVDDNFTNLNNDKLEKTGGTITANTSTPALTITQTGTGDALRVEDSASPDSTPFVIDASGNVGIGAAPSAGQSFANNKDITGATFSVATISAGQVRSDVTSQARYFQSFANTQATTFTCNHVHHYLADQGTFGAGSTVTTQTGFNASSALVGASTNYGFYSAIPSGAGRWNFYAAGTASNYFAGNVSIGGAAYSGTANQDLLQIRHSNSGGIVRAQVVNPNTTANTAARFDFSTGTANAYGILEVVEDGAGNATVSLSTGAGVNGGIRLNPAVGNVTVNTASGLGYGTGAGGTVTQATSKSTAVTLNKPCGQITMNNAALAAGAGVLFFVSNNLVSATDNVIVTFRSGASYAQNYTLRVASVEVMGFYVYVTNVSAGALAESIVINFAVIKGSNS